MSKPVVLITSATGRIGKELVARLAHADQFTVRACSFSPEKADSLRALGADQVVPFDLNDATTWDAALDGVSAVYSASLDPMLEGHLAFCKALGELGRKGIHRRRSERDCVTQQHADYLVTPGASGETGLDELWQGNLWKKGEDAMKDAAEVAQ